jgi:hypothetical protein
MIIRHGFDGDNAIFVRKDAMLRQDVLARKLDMSL